MTDERHPPRQKAAPLHGRGIVEFIPPLRGDSGGCAFHFFVSSLFTYSFIFRIDIHVALQQQLMMKIQTRHAMACRSRLSAHNSSYTLKKINYFR